MKKLKGNFAFNNIRAINFLKLSGRQKELVRLWRNHRQIRQWMSGNSLITPLEHKAFIGNLKNNSRDFYWLVKEDKGGDLGVIYLNRLDTKNRNAYLGIYVNPYLRKAGHKVMGCLKKIAFTRAGLHTLKLEVFEHNARALAFYAKEGFTREGVLKDFVFRGGKWINLVVMGLTKR